VEAYAKKNLTADDALVQARVARILRHTDYNFKTKEPILWTPPS
jgi:DNA polymerase-1